GFVRSGAFVASALYFSLTAAGSDSLIKSAAAAVPRRSALANGAATKPVAVSLMNRRRLGCAGDLTMGTPCRVTALPPMLPAGAANPCEVDNHSRSSIVIG